jgi:hypothetical protein
MRCLGWSHCDGQGRAEGPSWHHYHGNVAITWLPSCHMCDMLIGGQRRGENPLLRCHVLKTHSPGSRHKLGFQEHGGGLGAAGLGTRKGVRGALQNLFEGTGDTITKAKPSSTTWIPDECKAKSSGSKKQSTLMGVVKPEGAKTTSTGESTSSGVFPKQAPLAKKHKKSKDE